MERGEGGKDGRGSTQSLEGGRGSQKRSMIHHHLHGIIVLTLLPRGRSYCGSTSWRETRKYSETIR